MQAASMIDKLVPEWHGTSGVDFCMGPTAGGLLLKTGSPATAKYPAEGRGGCCFWEKFSGGGIAATAVFFRQKKRAAHYTENGGIERA